MVTRSSRPAVMTSPATTGPTPGRKTVASDWQQGWIKSSLPVLFRTDSFRTQIDYRQFQKFLLVIDSFGPNICGKICTEVLSHFTNYDGEVINQLTHTPESPLYWKRNASWWYSLTLLEKCWLMCLILFENLMDSFKKISIDSFKDFLVDQARQFQNTPNFRIDRFRFFWTYIHPCLKGYLLLCEGCVPPV